MPRIPMNQNTMAPVAGGPVYMREGLPASFGMDAGAALVDAGKTVAGIGLDIYSTAKELNAARVEFEEKTRANEDKLAAMEARNVYRKIQNENKRRMAENPGSFAEYGKWAEEADKKYEREAAPVIARMSDEFKKGFLLEMAGLREETVSERHFFADQAKVTDERNRVSAAYSNALLAGNTAEADRIAEDFFREGLFSKAELENFAAEKEHLLQFGAVKSAVEAGDYTLLEDLKEKSAVGYTNFSKITVQEREQLIRACEAGRAKDIAAKSADFVAQLHAGRIFTNDDIDKMFGDSTEEVETKNQLKAVNNTFSAKRDEAVSRQSAAEAQAAKDKKEQRDQRNAWRLYSFAFSPDPNEREKEFAELQQKIDRTYAGDLKQHKVMTDLLNENLKKYEKDQSGETTFLDSQVEFFLKKEIGSVAYNDTENDWFGEDYGDGDDEDIIAANDRQLAVAVALFRKYNPNASFEEIKGFVENTKSEIARTTIEKLNEVWLGITSGIKKDLAVSRDKGE